MRRRDREVNDDIRIDEIISQAKICRLGFYDEGEVYIVPLNYGYIRDMEQFTLYFHSAKSGRKIDLIKNCESVGFELDTGFTLMEGEVACDYSAYYASIIGNGKMSIVEDVDEKVAALQLIMSNYTGRDDWEYSEESLRRVAIMKMEVTKFSCKEHSV